MRSGGGGAGAPWCPLQGAFDIKRTVMAFDQGVEIFHQQSGAQIGQLYIGIHDQGRFIGQLENRFPADDFGGILLGVTGEKNEAV